MCCEVIQLWIKKNMSIDVLYVVIKKQRKSLELCSYLQEDTIPSVLVWTYHYNSLINWSGIIANESTTFVAHDILCWAFLLGTYN